MFEPLIWVKQRAPESYICYCPLKFQFSYAHDSTYFESLFDFGFIHLILDTFLRILLCAILYCFAFFLLILFSYSIEFVIQSLMLSNSSIWAFIDFLLFYSYVEDREWSYFSWHKTHWFGNFVGDYLCLEGRAAGWIVGKGIEIAFREDLWSELGLKEEVQTRDQHPFYGWTQSK